MLLHISLALISPENETHIQRVNQRQCDSVKIELSGELDGAHSPPLSALRTKSISVGCHLISFPLRRQIIDKKNEVQCKNFSILNKLNGVFAFEIIWKKYAKMCRSLRTINSMIEERIFVKIRDFDLSSLWKYTVLLSVKHHVEYTLHRFEKMRKMQFKQIKFFIGFVFRLPAHLLAVPIGPIDGFAFVRMRSNSD